MDFGVLVDVCLGVLAIMILFTLAAAAINEMIADNILNMRGKSLHDAIVGLLRKYAALAGTKDAAKIDATVDAAVARFYEAPELQSTMEERSWLKRLLQGRMSVKGDYRPPSAIEPSVFATVVARIVDDPTVFAAPADPAVLKAAVPSFASDFALTMDRVSGWYVRKVKTSLFVIGLLLAIGANVDLLRYAEDMADDANLSTRIDATAAMIGALEAKGGTPPGATPPADLSEATAALTERIRALETDLETAGLTVGWACVDEGSSVIGDALGRWSCPESSPHLNGANAPQILGWLIIAFGVTLGSQFWFDLFRSLVNLRTPGKTGGTAEELSASNTVRVPAPPGGLAPQ